jgi:hypothetical protein
MKTESLTPIQPQPTAAWTRLQVCHAIVKWVARTFSVPLIIFFSICLIGVVISGDYPGGQELLAGTFGLVGLLVAWRWELIGGGALFLGNSVNALVSRMQEEPWGFYIWWMLASLFLASGFLKRAVNPVTNPEEIKAARILAWIFTILAVASIGGCFAFGAYKHFNG